MSTQALVIKLQAFCKTLSTYFFPSRPELYIITRFIQILFPLHATFLSKHLQSCLIALIRVPSVEHQIKKMLSVTKFLYRKLQTPVWNMLPEN
jgi:primosomal protein N''